MKDCQGEPELIIIATGSEVGLAITSAEKISAKGNKVRVVSMPCCEIFDAQDAHYKEYVLPGSTCNRIAIEAGHPAIWYRYTGLSGRVIGMDSYGESAPGADLFKHFGFTVSNVVEQAEELLNNQLQLDIC